MLETEPPAAGIRLFDAGTAYLVTDILTGLRRPDLPTCWEFTSLPRVAWKTGTSYGHRDAWSIGYNPRYTVGVWLGNFSGAGARNLIGAEVAAPILFELMNSICRGQQIRWFTQPASVETREVCGLSGQVPGPHCPTLVEEMYLPDRSPDAVCQFHQAVEIDDATGSRLPPHFPAARKSHPKVFVQWPPRVGSWMESKRLPRSTGSRPCCRNGRAWPPAPRPSSVRLRSTASIVCGRAYRPSSKRSASRLRPAATSRKLILVRGRAPAGDGQTRRAPFLRAGGRQTPRGLPGRPGTEHGVQAGGGGGGVNTKAVNITQRHKGTKTTRR